LAVDVSRAVVAGLTFRSIDEVVRDTLAWDRTRRDQPLRGPLAPDKEAAVLAAWKEKVA
jgi:2'-hydroxyisoflavone reductase